jgi:hypothetical protein
MSHLALLYIAPKNTVYLHIRIIPCWLFSAMQRQDSVTPSPLLFCCQAVVIHAARPECCFTGLDAKYELTRFYAIGNGYGAMA